MCTTVKSVVRHGLVGIGALGCSVLFEPDALKTRGQSNWGGQGTGGEKNGQGGGVSRTAGSSYRTNAGASSSSALASVGSSDAAIDNVSAQQTEPSTLGSGGDTTGRTIVSSTQGLGGTSGVARQSTTWTSNGGTLASVPISTSISGGSTAAKTANGTLNANGGTTATTQVVPDGGFANGGKGAGGAVPSGGTSSGGTHMASSSRPTPTLDGFASRYWSCCKPKCAWGPNTPGKTPATSCGKNGTTFLSSDTSNGCDSATGSAFLCNWAMPWGFSDVLAYGYAAHASASCGTCFRLVFTGSNHYGGSANDTAGKEMFVQIIDSGALIAGQFDLLIPGGGVGDLNGCTQNGHQ